MAGLVIRFGHIWLLYGNARVLYTHRLADIIRNCQNAQLCQGTGFELEKTGFQLTYNFVHHLTTPKSKSILCRLRRHLISAPVHFPQRNCRNHQLCHFPQVHPLAHSPHQLPECRGRVARADDNLVEEVCSAHAPWIRSVLGKKINFNSDGSYNFKAIN